MDYNSFLATKVVILLLKKDLDINLQDKSGRTALMMAIVQFGKYRTQAITDIIKLLIHNKADGNLLNKQHESALDVFYLTGCLYS